MENTADEECRGYFDRIRLFNFMARDIVNFAAQKYGPEFVDYMDMNCGAMPEGEYEGVIDQGAPMQFLELYAGMVVKRLELAAKKILELGDGFDAVLKKYFFTEGQNLGLKKPETVMEAYGIVRLCSLDSSVCKDEVTVNQEKELCWKKSGSISPLYWTLILKSLLEGIFKDSPIGFSVSEDMLFSLKMA